MNNDQLYFYNRGFNDCLAKFVDANLADLTDEEIHKLWLECWDEIEFARAILRKAQEK